MVLILKKKAAQEAPQKKGIILKRPAAPVALKPLAEIMPVFDKTFLYIRKECGSRAAVNWFLITSYMHSVLRTRFLSDEMFERVRTEARSLIGVEAHEHLDVVEELILGGRDPADAAAYPNVVVGAASHLRQNHLNKAAGIEND